MRFGASILLGLVLLSAPATGAPDSAADAAEAVGVALTSSDLRHLRAVLPAQGRVRLKLVHFGPEDGQFSAGQVEAILKDFLANGSVETFEILRVEGDDRTYGMAVGRVALVDRNGRSRRVALLLTFQPEASRWVLRELKETPE